MCQALCCGLSCHLPELALPAGRNGPVSRGRKPEPRDAESLVWAHAARQPDVNERLPLSARLLSLCSLGHRWDAPPYPGGPGL